MHKITRRGPQVAGGAHSDVSGTRPALLNITSPHSSSPNRRWVDLHETAINPRPRSNINLPSSRTWSTGRLHDCPRPTPYHATPPPPNIHSPDQQTALFLTWRFEVDEGSASFALPRGTGSSAPISCFCTIPTPLSANALFVLRKLREYLNVPVSECSLCRCLLNKDQTSIMQFRK
jgi:hypothetical protein